MKAIRFKEVNVEYAKDQDQYNTLPANIANNTTGDATCCFRFTFWEKIKVLFGAKVWLTLWTFNNPLQPICIGLKKPKMIK